MDSSDLINFVYEKVVEEEVWEIKIVENRARRETVKKLALNRSKEFYDESEEENEARIQFAEVFSDFLIEIDDISEKCEINSLDWYWDMGQVLKEQDVASNLKNNSHQALGELVPNEQVDGDILIKASNIHDLFPNRDLPDTGRITMLEKLKYYADSIEQARNVLSSARDNGFIPMNREIRVWKDVKSNPELTEIASQVNRRFSTYNDGSKVEHVQRVYQICKVDEESIPKRDEIYTAIENQ